MPTINVIEIRKQSVPHWWLRPGFAFIPHTMSNAYGDIVTVWTPTTGNLSDKFHRLPITNGQGEPRFTVMSLHKWMAEQYVAGRPIYAMIPHCAVLTNGATQTLGMRPGDIIGVELNEYPIFGTHDVYLKAKPLLRTGETPTLKWCQGCAQGIFDRTSPCIMLQPLTKAQAYSYQRRSIAVMPAPGRLASSPPSQGPLQGPLVDEDEAEPDNERRDVMDLTKEFFRGY